MRSLPVFSTDWLMMTYQQNQSFEPSFDASIDECTWMGSIPKAQTSKKTLKMHVLTDDEGRTSGASFCGSFVQDCCPCEPKSPCQFPSTTWRQEKVGSQVPTKPVGALYFYLSSTNSILLAWWEKRHFCADSTSRLQRVRNLEFKNDNEKASFENTTISLIAGITNCTLLFWYQNRYSAEFY